MGVEEKNRNEILSRLAAELFVMSKADEELSSKIHRLRDEIKKVMESEDTTVGKFRALVASFEKIIPEEKQRYNAAIKALSTTAKLSREEIVKAVDNMLEELKILEKGLMSALPGWRDELKVMEAKSQEMRDEISKLREKIGQLESEEKGVLSGIMARKMEMEPVEKAVGELFRDIGAEITYIKKRIGEFTAESAAAQPIPTRDSVKSYGGSEEKGGGERTAEIPGTPLPRDAEWQKKCPMCGGRMNYHSTDGMWLCYACAYQELEKADVQGTSKEKSEPENAPEPALSPEPNFDPTEPITIPSETLSSDEYQEPKKKSSPSNNRPSSKKKACPACRWKMDWYKMESAWRCPHCGYERRL
jgi:ribosomal protein L37AE/L43A